MWLQIGAFITDRVMRTRSWVEHLTTWIRVLLFGVSTPALAGWKVLDGGVLVFLSAYCWVLETQTTVASCMGGDGVLVSSALVSRTCCLAVQGLTVR